MSREEEIIKRYEQELVDLGYNDKKKYLFDKNGYGDFESFFDFLLDLKLIGQSLDDITKQGLWESMKSQMNYLETCAVQATEEHRKLENEIRNLRKEKEELIRSK